MMGAHVLEQARLHGVAKTVLLGTICAYPKFAPVPFHEDDLWNGYPEETNAPYGVAKKALLVGAQSYREQYGTNAIYLLPVNLYGPRDNFDLETSHVIPALIRKMVEAQERGEREIVLWGDGTPTREFLYVDDCAEGIRARSAALRRPRAVNLGTGHEISIRDLAELIAELTGFDGEIVWDASKPNGQPRRQLDVSRAEELFGFRAPRRAARRARADDRVVPLRCLYPGASLHGDSTATQPARFGRIPCARELPRVSRRGSAGSQRCDRSTSWAPSSWPSGSSRSASALTVRHNGWIYYQGGDQVWYYTTSWLLAHGQVPLTAVGYGWSVLLLPFTARRRAEPPSGAARRSCC